MRKLFIILLLLGVSCTANATMLLKQSASRAIPIRMTYPDGITAFTGGTLTVVFSANGASYASPSGGAGAIAEVGNGLYTYTASAADLGTLGYFDVYVTSTGAIPQHVWCEVVLFDPQAVAVGANTTTPPTAASNGSAAATAILVTPTNKIASDTLGDTTYNNAAPPSAATISSTVVSAMATAPVGSVAGSVNSVTTGVTVLNYATHQDPAYLVLGATASSWNTDSTIGYAINNSGGGGGATASQIWNYNLTGVTGGVGQRILQLLSLSIH